MNLLFKLMKNKFLLSVSILAFFSLSLFAQMQKNKGYPTANPDLRSEFVNPPKGYGNIPFYWWSGDRLNKERLKEQLEILSQSATDGFSVSYIHTDPEVDSVFNKNGYGLFGRTSPGNPPVFSEDWWNIWNWFSGECAQLGLGVGLDDYTIGWNGNGYYPDELDTMSVFQNYQGKLVIDSYSVNKGELFTCQLPERFLSAVAWPGRIDLSGYIHGKELKWKVPRTENYKIYVIHTENSYVLHPLHGKKLVEVYFDRFYHRMDSLGREGMNYFFQDELSYPINMLSWSDDFPQEFQRRKGYDVIPYLPALKEYIGAVTPKIRLDYADVLISLAEERYFEPIYRWHRDKGLIYGCDNLGRGKNPLAYVDYFRAISWYTAPGNDAPSRGSSFLETKVSSSVAHLYHRPRTWLEAFHSMGWGSSGSWLTQQIDHHFIAGGNLVCMHGLYYSTHGGWWEWAPPCFHFRMPYWPHMKKWLEYTERMSYVLSQGKHICDIALVYPTDALQAYPDKNPDRVFDLALRLSNKGLDYDFVDYHSLRKAISDGKHLSISGNQYKILILADMKAVHYTTLLAARDFYRAGGIVLATDDLPIATSNRGEGDKEIDAILQELFGLTAQEALAGKEGEKQINKRGGIGWYLKSGQIPDNIYSLIMPDFKPLQGEGKVLHRKIGKRDFYMVMNVPKDSECFFRSKGKLELWNAMDGSITTYPVLRQTEDGTYVKLRKDYANSYLFVFSSGEPVYECNEDTVQKPVKKIRLSDDWYVKLIPTLNNKWGDFRLPASNHMIGAEARSFHFAPEDEMQGNAWTQEEFVDSTWEESFYGYGPQAVISWGDTTAIHKDTLSYSWKYGVWDQPGSQGWHGLKGKVSDGFFILNKGGTQSFETFVYADTIGNYTIVQDGVDASVIEVNGKSVTASDKIHLLPGWHHLSVLYYNTKKQNYQSQTGSFRDTRKRGAVVFLPENAPLPEKTSVYSDSIAMKWFYANHLRYDLYKGQHKRWCYRFKSVPGLKGLDLWAYGKDLKMWINGNKVADSCIEVEHADNLCHYRIVLPEVLEHLSTVAFSLETMTGYQATLALSEPIKLFTEDGIMRIGDWSKMGSLRFYSGGINYAQSVHIPKNLSGKKITLDLGEIIATCEVKVNGSLVGILLSPPYQLDITPYIKEGNNKVEILVYSTLANHYQTTPTPYRGDPKAGLIGPVNLLIE